MIEETPASAKLTPRLRSRVSSLALRLGQAIGYTNAGTVEFLVSGDGSVYFLEMNTRLQVEHGVTELVTGLDLVETQLRVAFGEPLPFTQEDVECRGHAIEARIYPEDPETFMPDAGDITGLHLPTGGNVRVDTALCNGYSVGLDYEPLLAKIMAWGEDRTQAIKTLQGALLELRLEGVKNNVPLLREILASKEFGSATYHTGSVPKWVHGMQNKPHHHSTGGVHKNGHANGHKPDKEIAAAIGVAMAMAMSTPSPVPASSAWRIQGRREQLLSRTLGSRGWP